MDSTSSIAGISSYPPSLSGGLDEAAFGQDPRLHPERASTQPFASRPIDPQCGDSDSDGDDDSSIGALEQRVDGANWSDDGGGAFGTPQPL